MKELKFNYDKAYDKASSGWEAHIIKDVSQYPLPEGWAKEALHGNKRGVCVDVGANVGIFAAFWTAVFERFICVEPSQANCDRMVSNFARLEVGNAQILRKAAWGDSDSGFKLGYGKNKKRPGDCTLWTSASPHPDFETVATICLSDIMKECSVDKIDLLKVDIEGSEYEFLYDQDLTKVNSLIVELHSGLKGKKKIGELVKYIASCGFNAWRKRDESLIAADIASVCSFDRGPHRAPTDLKDVAFLEEVKHLESLSYATPTVLFMR
jgi:FkbM family methyltransferase